MLRTLASGSLHVRVSERTGPDVLLLHGIPGSSVTWDGVARRLNEHHRTIVPDLLGFGDSPAFTVDGHAGEQAQAVLTMLDTLEVRKTHVAGFDFGGPTALELYRLAPSRVASLTLAATNVFTDTPIPLPLQTVRIPGIGRVISRLFFGRAGLALMWLGATGDRRAFPFQEFRKVLRSGSSVRTTRHIFTISLENLPRFYSDVEGALSRVAVPSTVVWGDRDPFFSVEIGRRAARAIPDAKFEVLPGCGHFIPGERPRELADLIASTAARSDAER